MAGRHAHPRVWPALLLYAALLAGLLALGGWALAQAHTDCVAGRITGPWC